MPSRINVAVLLSLLLASSLIHAADWPQPYRAVLQIPPGSLPGPNSVVGADLNFAGLLGALGAKDSFNAYSLKVEALDGSLAGQALPFRFSRTFNPGDQSYETAGRVVFVVPKPDVTRVAVYFGPKGPAPEAAEFPALIGDGDLLRIAGDGQGTFSGPACYPEIIDFDGDGKRDIVGSNRYGTGSLATWYRNIGTDSKPLFSEREVIHLRTADGNVISNPNNGWMLTVALCDWDGDSKRDLLVGGWCRYLTFHKNTGSDAKPVYAAGKRIYDAKVFPGFDYGSNADTPYQGVFIEPCDWDGDGRLDLLCGTYARGHMYFLQNTGPGEDGLPVLGAPVGIQAGDKEIDFLTHNLPSVGDFDGDGDLDMMAGQYNTDAAPTSKGVAGCYYFENIGDRKNPKLAEGVQIRDADGKLCQAGFHMNPVMVDWNKDGKMDVLISGADGTFLYLNNGTPKEPKLVRSDIPFRGESPCQVNGMFAYPVADDRDGDGVLDIVTGDGEGNVLFFKGLKNLQYAAPVKVKSEGVETDEVGCPDGGEAHRGYVKVALADWNGDGFKDLIMWTNNGEQGWQHGFKEGDFDLKFFPGTKDPLDFGPSQPVMAEGKHILAAYRSKPDVADMDGDGLLDLVVAVGGPSFRDTVTLTCFKNVGTKTDWKLAAGVPFVDAAGNPCTVGVRSASCVADWDGDGDPDLLTGHTSAGLVRFWKNVGTREKPVWENSRVAPVQEIVNSHHEVGVDVVDLDKDGTLDLIVGNGDSGVIHFFRSSFLKAQPEAKVLEAESSSGKKAGMGTVTVAQAAAEGRETMAVPQSEATASEKTWLLMNCNGAFTGAAGEKPLKEAGEFVEGKFGQGVHLTEKQVISLPTAGNLDPKGGVVQVWVKPDWAAGDGKHHYILSADNKFPSNILWLLVNDKGQLTFQSSLGPQTPATGTILRSPKLNWAAGEWHLVRLEWGADRVRMFADGIMVAAADKPVLPDVLADRFYVGAMFNGNWCFEGALDDVEITGLQPPPQ